MHYKWDWEIKGKTLSKASIDKTENWKIDVLDKIGEKSYNYEG